MVFDTLSHPVQLNVLADLKAKEAVDNAVESNTLNQYRLFSLPHIKCEIRIVESTTPNMLSTSKGN